MITKIQRQIFQAQDKLTKLRVIRVKSECDIKKIKELRQYIADLYENLGELKREQAGRERGW